MQTTDRKVWTTPRLTTHGDIARLTGTVINKTPGVGDFVVINGVPVAVPGSQVIP